MQLLQGAPILLFKNPVLCVSVQTRSSFACPCQGCRKMSLRPVTLGIHSHHCSLSRMEHSRRWRKLVQVLGWKRWGEQWYLQKIMMRPWFLIFSHHQNINDSLITPLLVLNPAFQGISRWVVGCFLIVFSVRRFGETREFADGWLERAARVCAEAHVCWRLQGREGWGGAREKKLFCSFWNQFCPWIFGTSPVRVSY